MTQSHNTTGLPSAIDAPRQRLQLPSGIGMAWYATEGGDGPPLVLLHSVNAAPSAFEMKPLFDHYRTKRQVLAPELPGFGASDRPDLEYSPEFYADALCEWLTATVDGAVDMVALSLSAEFAARAARQAPDLFRSLTLISPTGFGRRKPPSPSANSRVDRLVRNGLLGPALYRLLTSRISIRYFLDMSFVGRAPRELVDYAYVTSHQPGARFAPFAFLTFRLFTPDALNQLYAPLQLPVTVLFDTDPNISFEQLDELVDDRSNWTAHRISPSRGLPHFDQTDRVISVLDEFWDRISAI